jgi:hypothetical protein
MLFFVQIYFDIADSVDYDFIVNKNAEVTVLRSKIIGKLMAYTYNEKKINELEK